MNNSIVKTVLAGLLAGVALFMIPFFLIKILLFVLLVKAIFRLLGFRRGGMHPAFAHKFQNMTEEERTAFMQKFGGRCAKFAQKEAVMDDKTMI